MKKRKNKSNGKNEVKVKDVLNMIFELFSKCETSEKAILANYMRTYLIFAKDHIWQLNTKSKNEMKSMKKEYEKIVEIIKELSCVSLDLERRKEDKEIAKEAEELSRIFMKSGENPREILEIIIRYWDVLSDFSFTYTFLSALFRNSKFDESENAKNILMYEFMNNNVKTKLQVTPCSNYEIKFEIAENNTSFDEGVTICANEVPIGNVVKKIYYPGSRGYLMKYALSDSCALVETMKKIVEITDSNIIFAFGAGFLNEMLRDDFLKRECEIQIDECGSYYEAEDRRKYADAYYFDFVNE